MPDLINCPTCTKRISKNAYMCPECGEWQGHPFEGNLLLYKEKMTGSSSGALTFFPFKSSGVWWQDALGFLLGGLVFGIVVFGIRACLR